MKITAQTAKHLKDVYLGGNWTVINFKDTLKDITWQQAIKKNEPFNTIVTLVYHCGYFVEVLNKVLEGGPLDGKDAYSFNHPPINSDEDWQQLLNNFFSNGEKAVRLIEQLSDEKLSDVFFDEKYGSYYRNINGIIEHLHYHLGQISILKRII